MSSSHFYLQNNLTPSEDQNFTNGVGAAFMQYAVSALSQGAPAPISFALGVVGNAGLGYSSDVAQLSISPTGRPNEIRMGNEQVGYETYHLDNWTDAIVGQAFSTMALAMFGLLSAPASVAALAVVGVSGLIYSKFLDPITDDIILTLGGQDEIKVVGANGELYAGYIYPDGLDHDNYAQYVEEVISDPNLQGFNFNGAEIKFDTDLGPSLDYTISDASAFEKLADRVGSTLPAFLAAGASNSDYTNDQFYAKNTAGADFIYSAQAFSTLDQHLAVPLTFSNGQNVTAIIGNLYDGWGHVWGDNLNGSSGYSLTMVNGVSSHYLEGAIDTTPLIILGNDSGN